jgi:hypothetical protein
VVQRQPSTIQRIMFLIGVHNGHGSAQHKVRVFLFAQGVIEYQFHFSVLNGVSETAYAI